MPHGNKLLATRENNFNYCLLFEQPSPAKITSYVYSHFYYGKRLLRTNNIDNT